LASFHIWMVIHFMRFVEQLAGDMHHARFEAQSKIHGFLAARITDIAGPKVPCGIRPCRG